MNDELAEMFEALTEAVNIAKSARCPQCGGKWDDPLDYERSRGWFCKCGWRGAEANYVENSPHATRTDDTRP